jgi:DNA-directed RNA polymerase subunit RPC12/RpoP
MKHEETITCPNCHQTFTHTYEDGTAGPPLKCPHCGLEVNLLVQSK